MQSGLKIRIDDVPDAALRLARKLRGGEVLALIGPLGAGKTTFTQALGKALGVRKKMTSPTFVLMQQYKARIVNKDKAKRPITLYHLDLYRSGSFREVTALGITEHWNRPDTVTVIEWADKIKRHLPKHTIYIHLTNPHT
jgi:tRNA threonylcarbamoyladenosine biosynthesis protein TsaE